MSGVVGEDDLWRRRALILTSEVQVTRGFSFSGEDERVSVSTCSPPHRRSTFDFVDRSPSWANRELWADKKSLARSYSQLAPMTSPPPSQLQVSQERPSPACASRRKLAQIHVLLVSFFTLAVVVASAFVSDKWTRLSPRLDNVSLRSLESQWVNEKRMADFAFAQEVMMQPASFTPLKTATVIPKTLFYHTKDDGTPPKDLRLSTYVPSHEKQVYKERLRLRDQAPGPDFSTALVCTNLFPEWHTSLPPAVPTQTSASQCDAMPVGAGLQDASCHASDIDAMLPSSRPSLSVFDTPTWLPLRRRCILWSRNGAPPMPRMLEATAGLLSPNYPLTGLLRSLTNPVFAGVVILISWSHALTLPQPVSVIHAPRLGFYFLFGLWRLLLLHFGLGFIESLTYMQGFLKACDAKLGWSPYWKRSVMEVFDFSDHIVYFGFLSFVLTTEMFCLWHFSDQKQPGEEDATIDNPFSFPKTGKLVLSCICASVVVVLLYGCLVTAAFYHSPLEALGGIMVAMLGIYLPFWLLIVLDFGLLPQYFGLQQRKRALR